MTMIYQEDTFMLETDRITDGKHPLFGDTTIFHDAVIASEIVQEYGDGYAFKSRDELAKYAWTADNQWVVVGGHPEAGIVSDISQVAGRTINVRYVKNLLDSTGRPARAGVRADVEIFNDRVSPKDLKAMKNGSKRDVSIGFFFHKDNTPGDFKGDSYDYVQRDMFHNHLAAGIDNGRCPSPLCGLGADEIKSLIGDPFAGFANFQECRDKITSQNPDLSEEAVNKICGSLKARHEDTISEEDLVKYASKILNEVVGLYSEIEALKGEQDALKETGKPWYTQLDWSIDENTEIFDHLNEETRTLIIDAGLCPTCKEEDANRENLNGPAKCAEGLVWSDVEKKCVPADEDKEDVKLTLPADPESHKDPHPRIQPHQMDTAELLERAKRVLSNHQ